MSLSADQIVDRRSLRRKVTIWRVAAFLLLSLLILIAGFVAAGENRLLGVREPQIARLSIVGFIADDHAQLELIDEIAETEAVKGVIVSINSTGGSTVGGEALYEALRRLSEAKPTVATIETVGASAAYMAAIATDHIVARRSSITGSIGVIFQYPEFSELLDKVGVSVETIKSAPLKAAPSMFEPSTPPERAVIQSIVEDSYDWFVDIVGERRALSEADALRLSDGRIYSGRQALEEKLIDEIGGEEAALAWLESQDIDSALPIRDWAKPEEGGGFFSSQAFGLWIMRQFGLNTDILPSGLADRLFPDPRTLDGLVSVWQGPTVRHSRPIEGVRR